jgi:hypothetical protein
MDGLRRLDHPSGCRQYDASCAANGIELQDSRNKADRSSFSETTATASLLERAGLAERLKPKPK